MSQYCWTTNILSPENYPLYGIIRSFIEIVAWETTNLFGVINCSGFNIFVYNYTYHTMSFTESHSHPSFSCTLHIDIQESIISQCWCLYQWTRCSQHESSPQGGSEQICTRQVIEREQWLYRQGGRREEPWWWPWEEAWWWELVSGGGGGQSDFKIYCTYRLHACTICWYTIIRMHNDCGWQRKRARPMNLLEASPWGGGYRTMILHE